MVIPTWGRSLLMAVESRQGMGIDGESHEEFITDLARESRVSDIVLLLVVPAFILGLYNLPLATKSVLALKYLNPTPVAAYTAHFIHLTPDHLAANLVGYLVLVPELYVLAVLADRRQEFLISFFTFLVAFPFAISALNIMIERPRIGYGFSGILMAFSGLLPILLLDYVGIHLADGVAMEHSPALFLFGIVLVSVLAPPDTPLISTTMVIAGLMGIAYFRKLLANLSDPARLALRTIHQRPGYAECGIVGLTLFFIFIFAAFPRNPVETGTIINVYTHFLGFGLGFLVSFLTFRLAQIIEG